MSGQATSFMTMTVVAVASAGLFWLMREHWGHAFGVAPYLLFLACPVVHFFMQRGHGHGHNGVRK